MAQETQIAYLEKILAEEIVKFSNSQSLTLPEKFSVLNNIIEIKRLLIGYNKHHSTYLDFKQFFRLYIEVNDLNDFEYDEILIGKINSKLDFVNVYEKLKLLRIFKRLLKLNGHDNKAEECNHFINCTEIKCLQQKLGIKNIIRLIALWTSQTILHLCLSLLFLYLLTCAILAPAFLPNFEMFTMTKIQFSQDPIVNHILNVLSLLFDFDERMIVSSNSVWGVMLIILGKTSYILIILNFLIKKVIDEIKIKN